MALHGGIHVNNHLIGYWQANRKERLNDSSVDPVYRYAVAIELEGPPRSHQGSVEHRYNDGALALVAKIMAFAYEREKGHRGTGTASAGSSRSDTNPGGDRAEEARDSPSGPG